MGRFALSLWLILVLSVAACKNGPSPVGPVPQPSQLEPPHTAPAPPAKAERPLSDWVHPRNQHLALADVANGAIPEPGDLFDNATAYSGFAKHVAGKQGWEFAKLSDDNYVEYRVLLAGRPQGFLIVDGRTLNGGFYRITHIEWWNEREAINRRFAFGDALPYVLTSIAAREVPGAQALFATPELYQQYRSLFSGGDWEFRHYGDGLDYAVFEAIRSGKVVGRLTLTIHGRGIDDIKWQERK